MSDVHADVGTGDCAITVLHLPTPQARQAAQSRRVHRRLRRSPHLRRHRDRGAQPRSSGRRFALTLALLGSLAWCCGSLIGGSPAIGIRRLLHRDPKNGDAPTFYEVPRRVTSRSMWIRSSGRRRSPLPTSPAAQGSPSAACSRVPRQGVYCGRNRQPRRETRHPTSALVLAGTAPQLTRF